MYICHGNKYVSYYDGVLVFWQGNLSLLNCDDAITFLETINRCVPNSEVCNTARFQ